MFDVALIDNDEQAKVRSFAFISGVNHRVTTQFVVFFAFIFFQGSSSSSFYSNDHLRLLTEMSTFERHVGYANGAHAQHEKDLCMCTEGMKKRREEEN